VPTLRIDEQIGRVLGGRYRLLAALGAGSSANVFLADDVALERRVAVKILHPGLSGDDAFLRRFQLEAHSAAVLNHPNVLGVLDWGEDPVDGPYLVLEYLAGGSLRDLLDAGNRLTTSQAAAVAAQGAHALAYAHRRGIVHRDVKPANLLFDEEGRLRVADFGLARALAEAAWTEPIGTVLGTARYASPEQAQGRALDGRSDVYALSLVLVEAVTGHVPFEADTTIATLMARVGVDVEAPVELGALGPVIDRAARANPGDRPDAASLAVEMEKVGRRLPPPEPLPLAPSTEGSGSDRHQTELGEQRRRRRSAVARTEARLRHPTAGRDLVVGRAPVPAGVPAVGHPRSRRRLSLGRRRTRLVALVAVVALVGAAVFGVVVGRGVFVTTHAVPSLRGLPVAVARAHLARDRFVLKVSSRRYDASVAPGDVVSQSPRAHEQLGVGSTVDVVVSRGPRPVPVPDLSGKDELTAVANLARVGLGHAVSSRYDETVPAGTVLDWTPHAGLALPGTVVNIVISAGPAPRTIPKLSSHPYATAAAHLTSLGLVPVRQDAFNDTVPAGQVVSTEPGAGATTARGQSVTVIVSKGPDLVVVPDVTKDSVPAATTALAAHGLSATNVFGPPGGTVFVTNPPAGAQVRRGSGVNLYTR
jgi:eukaryotic-like serine/threonine-protein kinase